MHENGNSEQYTFSTSPQLMPRQPNKSLIDGLKILQYVISFPDGIGVGAVAKELGINVVKVHRLLRTLAAGGYLRQIKGRKYAPGSAVSVLAAQALQSTGFVRNVYPLLNELHKETGMLLAYGMLWNRQVAYLYHAKPEVQGGMGLAGHTVVEAADSRLGLIMLAGLSRGDLESRYLGMEIPGFESFEAFSAYLLEIDKQGYIYAPTDAEGNFTVAIRFKKDPAISLGIAGKIRKTSAMKWVEKLREIEGRIENRSLAVMI
jgi:DNA-binding IclR family transcriptional regulator